MKILNWFKRKPKQEAQSRGFNSADLSRLTSDWLASNTSADSEIYGNVKVMRARARSLERDNDYARRYYSLVLNNVLGHRGITIQAKVKERVKSSDGKWKMRYDTLANQIIEDAFAMWGKKENCTIHRKYNWVGFQHLTLRSCVRDGACLIRTHTNKDNPFLFELELIEIDQLDEDYNATHGDGTVTRMGIRRNARGEVVSYRILSDHPGELFQVRANGKYSNEIDAGQIIHVYRPERIGQSTGFPWMVSSILRLKHLSAYEEAEVVASRIGASKMGFFVPNQTATGGYGGAEDPNGRKYMEVEPGSIEIAPRGYDFKSFDPTHPSTAFKDFVKATLRGISAGLGVSYTSLANDLESVNYSSIRAGLLEEREEWKTVQEWFISSVVQPIFERWLESAAMAGALKNSEGGPALPASKLAKWNQVEYKPRRWPWVDPLGDLQAAVLSVEKGFDSRRSIISERGGDIEDTFGDLEQDQDLAELHGLDFSDSQQTANAKPTTPKEPAALTT